MLSAHRRLRASEVRVVIASGKTVRGTHLSIKFLPAEGESRSAVVVSKKLAKTAVSRNRVRRQVYQALREEPLPARIQAVLFVQALPALNALPTFVRELHFLCSKLSS